jgi:antitoxin FitA
MATLLIRNLDDAVRDKLRVCAAEHGRSMEAEARAILAAKVAPADNDDASEPGSGAELWDRLSAVFSDLGGVDFPEFPDEPYKPRPVWDEAEREDQE